MITLPMTAYDLAERFVGVKEVSGPVSNALVLAMLRLDEPWPTHDEVPWCSAFVNFVCWMLRLPRSKSLRARSWLTVGTPVHVLGAVVGFDIVVLSRGSMVMAPPATVLDGPGHVGFFAGAEGDMVSLLGGNQNNQVSVSQYSTSRILGIRRLLR
jgi:uncharacterized protein (TIGR02594 family)